MKRASCSTGNNLEQCKSDADQCCTPSYLNSVKDEVTKKMQIFLRDEFDDVIDGYLDDFDDLIDCKATLITI